MRKVLFSAALLLTSGLAFAQLKSVKEAKSLAESSKFEQAEALINEAMSNPETKAEANTWNVAGLIQKKISQKEMEQAYLQQPFDTATAYNSIYKMFNYFFKCDELEQIPDEKGKVKFKYRRANTESLKNDRLNLINGGIYYFNLNNPKEAYKFFSMYVDAAGNPMLAQEDYINKDTLLNQIAYYAVLTAAQNGDNKGIIKYSPMAANDREVGKYALEYQSNAYKAMGDTVSWVATLKEGVEKFPDYPLFFGHLVDYYSNKGDFKDAVIMADKMLAKNPNDPFFLYVKGYLYQNMKDYDNAISFYKKTIEVNPVYAEAYSNLGYIYCQQGIDYADKVAVDVNDPKFATEQAKVKKFYEEARPYYEKARALKPDQKDLWLNGLYNVYYKLNMGKEFEEIDKMLSK